MTDKTAVNYVPVNKMGDTMLGTLTLNADPVANLDAATKQYVDDNYATEQLDNLSAVAINTSLVSDTDLADNLGSGTKRWDSVFAESILAGDSAGNVLTLGARDVDGAATTEFITLTSNNTPTCALSGDVTGVTQSADDNSTKLATTAYADYAAIQGGASKSLDNLSAVAVNTSLISDSDLADNLGSQSLRWNALYAGSIQTGNTASSKVEIGAWDVDGAGLETFITLTANNTPTCVLASGVTATTQAANNNSTKIATTSYVDSSASGKALTDLSNLSGIAINTSLISDADITDNLGSLDKRWNNVYTANVSSGDTAADVLTLSAYDVDGAVNTPFITLTSNNTPTCAIASGVTGVTQTIADNSTKLATTAYADAAAAGSGPFVKIASYSQSTPGATWDISNIFTTTYLNYVCVFTEILASTDATTLNMRVGTGAGPTWVSGASDYSIAVAASASSFVLGTAAYANNVLLGSMSFIVNAINPSSSTVYKVFSIQGSGRRATTFNSNLVNMNGLFKSATAVTSLRLYMAAGNISGKMTLYGMKDS